MKKYFLLLFVFTLIILTVFPFISRAQTESSQLYVTNISYSGTEFKIGDIVKGSFLVHNISNFEAIDIYYDGAIGKISKSKTYVVPEVGKSKLSGPLIIGANSRKEVNFEYTITEKVDGDLGIQIQIYMKSGMPLARTAKDIVIKGESLNIINGSLLINSDLVPLDSGPVVKKDDNSYLILVSDSLKVGDGVNLKLFDRAYDKEKVLDNNFILEKIVFDKKDVLGIKLPIDLNPGVYAGKASILEKKASELEFRYIIDGKQIDILSVNTPSKQVKKNQSLDIYVMVTGSHFDFLRPENDTSIKEFYTDIEIKNNKNEIVASGSELVNISPNEDGSIPELVFSLMGIKNSNELNIKVNILDKARNNVLAKYETQIINDEPASIPVWKIATLISCVVLLILILVFLFIRNRNKKKLIIPLILIFIVGLSFISSDYISAYTTGRTSWQGSAKFASVSNIIERLGKNPTRTYIAINSPLPYQVQGYATGSTVYLDLRAWYYTCANDGSGLVDIYLPGTTTTLWHAFKASDNAVVSEALKTSIKAYTLERKLPTMTVRGTSERVWAYADIGTDHSDNVSIIMPSTPGIYLLPIKIEGRQKTTTSTFWSSTLMYQPVCIIGAGLCYGEPPPVVPSYCPNLTGTYTFLNGVIKDSAGAPTNLFKNSAGNCVVNQCSPSTLPSNYGETCGCIASGFGTISCSGTCVDASNIVISTSSCTTVFGVSCSTPISPVAVGTSVTFTATSSNQTGAVNYSWFPSGSGISKTFITQYGFNNITVSGKDSSSNQALGNCSVWGGCTLPKPADFCDSSFITTYYCVGINWVERITSDSCTFIENPGTGDCYPPIDGIIVASGTTHVFFSSRIAENCDSKVARCTDSFLSVEGTGSPGEEFPNDTFKFSKCVEPTPREF